MMADWPDYADPADVVALAQAVRDTISEEFAVAVAGKVQRGTFSVPAAAGQWSAVVPYPVEWPADGPMPLVFINPVTSGPVNYNASAQPTSKASFTLTVGRTGGSGFPIHWFAVVP